MQRLLGKGAHGKPHAFKACQVKRALGQNGFKLIVFGCLAKTISGKVSGISDSIILCNGFRELALQFGSNAENDSLYFDFEAFSESPVTAIIPINSGCLNNCTFCSVKTSRGKLHSFPVESILRRFRREIKTKREIWLTSQDTGAYGFDINSSLPELLEALLCEEGDFRIRIGMANPWHFRRIESGLVPLFDDERLYKFLHIPLQSGSDRILSLMCRGYTAEYWAGLIGRLRASIPSLAISTDIITGFPTETESEFNSTLEALLRARPDTVNISRYGKRDGTIAAEMQGQVEGRIKSERSRAASAFAWKIALENNSALVGARQKALVSETGSRGGMVARTNSYRPVVLSSANLGEFLEVRIGRASANCLYAETRVPEAEKAPANAFNKV
ncbi:MAG: MiaB/RimO family radical SAM methylthiotransferase [archaeon]